MGKVIGHEEDGILTVRKSLELHLFRKLDAWGLDAYVLSTEVDVHTIQVIEMSKGLETGKVYEIGRIEFLEKGTPMQFRGHGLQFFLPRDEWRVTER